MNKFWPFNDSKYYSKSFDIEEKRSGGASFIDVEQYSNKLTYYRFIDFLSRLKITSTWGL